MCEEAYSKTMLSRVATAGARGALRARLPAASAGARARVPLIQPAFQSFHAGECGRVCTNGRAGHKTLEYHPHRSSLA